MTPAAIRKELSANDVGATGTHQAGLLIPKDPAIRGHFPDLPVSEKNPRAAVHAIDENGQSWKFAFIYYNNALFGGTRNEYRLTGMTRYLRETKLVAGDALIISKDGAGKYRLMTERQAEQAVSVGALRLGSGWKVINLKRR